MTIKNKYQKRSHISEQKFREILRNFCLDFNATVTSKITKVSRNTVNKLYDKFRQRITELSLKRGAEFGEFELDESYFGAKRVRGKRGRGAAGKTPVFGILKRNGEVYVTVIKKCSKEQIIPVIKGQILEGSTIHTDGWKAYDGLILNGYDHYRSLSFS